MYLLIVTSYYLDQGFPGNTHSNQCQVLNLKHIFSQQFGKTKLHTCLFYRISQNLQYASMPLNIQEWK